MTLVRTSGPDGEPVSVAELKSWLRLGHDSEDALLAGLIRAAREEAERTTGLALLEQQFRLALDDWPEGGIVQLPRFPLREVISVTVYDTDGNPAVVSPSLYQIDRHSRPARVRLSRSGVTSGVNGVDIEFTAGFGEGGPDVPATLSRAILLLAGHWYEFRAAYGPDDQPVSHPPAFDRLVSGYRDLRL